MPRGCSPHALLQSHEDGLLKAIRPEEGKVPTRSGPRLVLSEFSKSRWADEPLNDPPLHPSELDLIKSARSARIKRALLALARLLVASCIGVAAALAWQSYGDAARAMIAGFAPQLAWMAPAAPAAEATSASVSPDQLVAISHGLAAVRQSVDRLAADIARLQASKPDLASPDVPVGRTSALPPPVARKPVPPAHTSPPR